MIGRGTFFVGEKNQKETKKETLTPPIVSWYTNLVQVLLALIFLVFHDRARPISCYIYILHRTVRK